ncbi:MAG: dihydrofolate reductase [Lachnospiraceae bacterium]|nr:dihydrofolate reductase [Lachnospiraceae bacterium]
MVGLIVARSKNNVIGRNSEIPWKIKGEQKQFRELTTGHVVVMGRRSYEEIGHPLPNRKTIVISKSKRYEGENLQTAGSVEEAIALANGEDVYIAGGYGVYREAMPLVDVMYITEVDLEIPDGDVFFPAFDADDFTMTTGETLGDEVRYTRTVYTRRTNKSKENRACGNTDGQPSPVRRIAGDILIALALLLTVDVVVVMLRKINSVVLKADYRKVFRYELILCAILVLFAFDVRFGIFTRVKTKAARIVGWTVRSVVVLLTAVIVCFCVRVVIGGMPEDAGEADYAIVLGMALENGEPTADLLQRLDTAQEYLEKYPEARLILTGGNAGESGRTEAAVMRDILTGRGVPEDRMITEDQAATTKENFANTVKMLPAGTPVVLISSNYHMDRAVATAENAGFTEIMRLPAASGFLNYGANMMLEVILDLNELTARQ